MHEFLYKQQSTALEKRGACKMKWKTPSFTIGANYEHGIFVTDLSYIVGQQQQKKKQTNKKKVLD